MEHLGIVLIHELVPGLLRWFLFLLLGLVSLIRIAVGPRPELNLLVAAQGFFGRIRIFL
jgi:hypothetical protein